MRVCVLSRRAAPLPGGAAERHLQSGSGKIVTAINNHYLVSRINLLHIGIRRYGNSVK